tara:strand:+ start:1296 stop:1862 length:567 start_codon:yes stop_codon:yes gene_type:complete
MFKYILFNIHTLIQNSFLNDNNKLNLNIEINSISLIRLGKKRRLQKKFIKPQLFVPIILLLFSPLLFASESFKTTITKSDKYITVQKNKNNFFKIALSHVRGLSKVKKIYKSGNGSHNISFMVDCSNNYIAKTSYSVIVNKSSSEIYLDFPERFEKLIFKTPVLEIEKSTFKTACDLQLATNKLLKYN